MAANVRCWASDCVVPAMYSLYVSKCSLGRKLDCVRALKPKTISCGV